MTFGWSLSLSLDWNTFSPWSLVWRETPKRRCWPIDPTRSSGNRLRWPSTLITLLFLNVDWLLRIQDVTHSPNEGWGYIPNINGLEKVSPKIGLELSWLWMLSVLCQNSPTFNRWMSALNQVMIDLNNWLSNFLLPMADEIKEFQTELSMHCRPANSKIQIAYYQSDISWNQSLIINKVEVLLPLIFDNENSWFYRIHI